MELTAEGIARAVFEHMAKTECGEMDAMAYVHSLLLKNPEDLAALWRKEGQSIIRRWTNERLRGFCGHGPRPNLETMWNEDPPENWGRNRRREAVASLGLGALFRLPDGRLKALKDLVAEDVQAIVEDRRDIAARNNHHADEWEHVASFLAGEVTLEDAAAKLDERAQSHLRTVARTAETGKAA